MRRLLVLVAVLTATACASGPRATLEPLREAAASVEGGSQEASALALAGWHALFDGGDAKRAAALADRAVQEQPGDPWARFLRADLARRRLDPKGEAEELLTLVERAPGHPLAMVAAGRLAVFARRSPAIDGMLETRLGALLEKDRVAGEVRARVRGALRVLRGGDGVQAAASLIADSGMLTAGSVVGPFSDWHTLQADEPFPPERRAPVEASYGERGLRPFSFPGGGISLRGEESTGDVYYVLAVADVPRGGRYAVRLATTDATTAAVVIDGKEVVERIAFAGPKSSQVVQAIDLAAGEHLVAVRVVRGRGTGDAWVALAPLDGSPSPVRFRAAGPGDRPGAAPALVDAEALRRGNDAAALASALAGEGGVVGLYAAALDAARRDGQGARALVDRALAHAPAATPLLTLRAELLESDDTLPSKIAVARAGSDWEAVLARDPGHGMALLAGARILADAGRHEEALARIAEVAEAAPGSTAPELARARVALARGFDAQALGLARKLADSESDRCTGLSMIHDLSRRVDAVAAVDAAVEALDACGDGRSRLASHRAGRGDLDEAIRLSAELRAEDPQDTGTALRLADLLVATGKIDDAVAILERQEAYWPRNAWLPRRRAELLERKGDAAGAAAARERALSLYGGDLSLRRMAALEAGTDLLADVDRDGLEVIRSFEKNPRSYDSPAVLLLDLGAVEVYPDGSYVEKIHVVAKVLDKRGIDEFGEVHLPRGAEVVHLRTIKPDGRILVPEEIDGKESISMPGLAVGDYVEQSYLVARGAPSPAMQGWNADPFYFRSAGIPMLESIYVVRAHEKAGLELDVHNGMEGAAIESRGGWKTLTLRRTDVPALLPEPVAPSRREYLPWAQVGAGADESRLFPFFADNLAGAAAPTLEIERWAKEIAASVPQGEKPQVVRAVYDRAMAEIEGSDRNFSGSAAQVLASKRGNRLLLLKAAFAALGIDARYAAVRTFDVDPDPYRFPDASRWGHLALVVRPGPEADWIWLDPTTRWAPFGAVAPQAQGATAWILPEPGSTVAQRTTTPKHGGRQGRDTELRLVLDAEGALSGTGVERYLGFEGAAARAGLERMDPERRKQVIEASLARIFPGLTLESLELENEADGVAVRYAFRLPGFARDLGEGRQRLQLEMFQANLGRRFLARGSRETPLLVASAEQARISVQLELPEGATLVGGVEAAREHGPFGDYKRDVAVDGRTIAIREALDLHRNRVEPAAYGDFAAWVSAVDRAQSVELVIQR
ncbi:tetratricopeptide repeat protein [Vulgatibacter sp.]|uniref:tetratricopeptide repeat protein n=1 Tax=Vulgatibacter sp. TaxID=1971226 RepID=UPI0035655F63